MDSAVPDVTLVPVAIAYDLPPQHTLWGQVRPPSLGDNPNPNTLVVKHRIMIMAVMAVVTSEPRSV